MGAFGTHQIFSLIPRGIGGCFGCINVILEMRELLLSLFQQSASVFDKVSGNTEKQRSENNEQFVMVIVKPMPQPSDSISEAEKNRSAKSGALVLIGLLVGGIVAYLIIYAPFEKRDKDEAEERDD